MERFLTTQGVVQQEAWSAVYAFVTKRQENRLSYDTAGIIWINAYGTFFLKLPLSGGFAPKRVWSVLLTPSLLRNHLSAV